MKGRGEKARPIHSQTHPGGASLAENLAEHQEDVADVDGVSRRLRVSVR